MAYSIKQFQHQNDVEVVKIILKQRNYSAHEINSKINELSSQELHSLRKRMHY